MDKFQIKSGDIIQFGGVELEDKLGFYFEQVKSPTIPSVYNSNTNSSTPTYELPNSLPNSSPTMHPAYAAMNYSFPYMQHVSPGMPPNAAFFPHPNAFYQNFNMPYNPNYPTGTVNLTDLPSMYGSFQPVPQYYHPQPPFQAPDNHQRSQDDQSLQSSNSQSSEDSRANTIDLATMQKMQTQMQTQMQMSSDNPSNFNFVKKKQPLTRSEGGERKRNSFIGSRESLDYATVHLKPSDLAKILPPSPSPPPLEAASTPPKANSPVLEAPSFNISLKPNEMKRSPSDPLSLDSAQRTSSEGERSTVKLTEKQKWEIKEAVESVSPTPGSPTTPPFQNQGGPRVKMAQASPSPPTSALGVNRFQQVTPSKSGRAFVQQKLHGSAHRMYAGTMRSNTPPLSRKNDKKEEIVTSVASVNQIGGTFTKVKMKTVLASFWRKYFLHFDEVNTRILLKRKKTSKKEKKIRIKKNEISLKGKVVSISKKIQIKFPNLKAALLIYLKIHEKRENKLERPVSSPIMDSAKKENRVNVLSEKSRLSKLPDSNIPNNFPVLVKTPNGETEWTKFLFSISEDKNTVALKSLLTFRNTKKISLAKSIVSLDQDHQIIALTCKKETTEIKMDRNQDIVLIYANLKVPLLFLYSSLFLLFIPFSWPSSSFPFPLSISLLLAFFLAFINHLNN